MIRLEIKNYNTILTEKQKKISQLSSGKTDTHEYFIGEKFYLLIKKER